PSEIVTRQEHADATVIRIGVRRLLEGEQLVAVRETLDAEAEVGSRHRSMTSPRLPHAASKQLNTLSLRLTLKVRPRPSPRWIGQAQRLCSPLPRNLDARPSCASTRSIDNCCLMWAKSM